MPQLSIYIGESKISALYYESAEKFDSTYFPYTNIERSGEKSSDDRFIKEVTNLFFGHFGANSENCEVIIKRAGEDLSLKNENFDWLMLGNFAASTKNGFCSEFPLDVMQKLGSDEIAYFSNKEVYPFYTSINDKHTLTHDSYLKFLAKKLEFNPVNKAKILLSGERFTQFSINPTYTYLLAFDLIESFGAFGLFLDLKMLLPNTGNFTSISNDGIFEESYHNLGTLLKMHGGGEVLIEKEGAQKQLISLKDNDLFVFPLGETETARILVSSKKHGKLETSVTGGELGLILDSRPKSYSRVESSWINSLKESKKVF